LVLRRSRLNLETVDVFTDNRFGGNQLAVIADARGLSTEVMQGIASEFNYSEVTFVGPASDPSNTARVRIFRHALFSAAAAILPSKNSRSRKRVVTQVLPTFPAGT
jgi:predicted PhzF superfamily epimerase YddE/YHI9